MMKRHEKSWYITLNWNALWEDVHSSTGYLIKRHIFKQDFYNKAQAIE